MNIGALDTRIRWEYPVDAGTSGVREPVWTVAAVTWANVQDVMPSRAESVAQGVQFAKNQTRIRYRYGLAVDTTFRAVICGPTERVLQVISGPAAIGERNTYCEVMAESISV